MKRILTVALAGILSVGTFANIPVQTIYAQEESQETNVKTITNSFEYTIHTSKQAYLDALNDEHFFDDKKNDNPLYDLLKEQIIKIAKGEGLLTFTFDLSKKQSEKDIKEVLDQIIKDMEPYFYWSNGKGMYWYTEDKETSKNQITFTFFVDNQVVQTASGTYTDGNGNELIPWEKVEQHYYTLDELKLKYGDSLFVVLDDDNQHILFVGGNFSDTKVSNADEALQAIESMKKLMGISDNITLVNSKTTSDNLLGNTYYSFTAAQDQGLNKDKIVIIGVDSQGEVCCISNAPQDAWAEEDAKATDVDTKVAEIAQYGITLKDSSARNIVYYSPLNQYCYEFIGTTATGKYAKVYIPVVNCDERANINIEYYNSDPTGTNEKPYDFYFDVNKEEIKYMDFQDAYGNTVSLPVAYEKGKGYYFLDLDHKIVGTTVTGNAQTYIFQQRYDLLPLYYFDSAENASPIMVSAFYNMMNTFAEYSELNLYKDDTPVLVNFNQNYQNYNADAIYWSDAILINIYDSIIGANYDVVSHELTHAIQMIVSNDTQYNNANGAIMESYADICGNILEMIAADNKTLSTGKTDVNALIDQEYWTIGESTQAYLRFMSEPEAASAPKQTSKVYGNYFEYPVTVPATTVNDTGGVHINSGILNNIAYRMYKDAGINKENLLKVFYLTEYLFNINSDYDNVCQYVLYYMNEINKENPSTFTSEQIEKVKEIFNDANVQSYDPDKTEYDTNVVPDQMSKVTVSLVNGNNKHSLILSGTYGTSPQLATSHQFTQSEESKTEYERFCNTGETIYQFIVTDEDFAQLTMPNLGYQALGLVDFSTISEGENNFKISENDAVGNLYSYISHILTFGEDANIRTKLNTLKEEYSDSLEVILVKADNLTNPGLIQVANYNKDNDAVGTFYMASYNTTLGGFDLLLEKKGTYSFAVLAVDGQTELGYYKNVSIDTNVKDNILDLSLLINLDVANETISEENNIKSQTEIDETVESSSEMTEQISSDSENTTETSNIAEESVQETVLDAIPETNTVIEAE